MANSDILKCSSCNIVINELLTFVRHVIDFTDEESIHQLCTNHFSEEEIVDAKTLLYDSLPNAKKMPVRRKQGKKRKSRDLDDIIALMKGTDRKLFPIFCARDLDRIPPVTFDHVDATTLIKQLLALQNRFNMLEEKAVSKDEFNLLKQEMDNMKYASLIEYGPTNINVNKRGCSRMQNSCEMNSGPIGMQYVQEDCAGLETSQSAESEVNDRPITDLQIPPKRLVKSSEVVTTKPKHRLTSPACGAQASATETEINSEQPSTSVGATERDQQSGAAKDASVSEIVCQPVLRLSQAARASSVGISGDKAPTSGFRPIASEAASRTLNSNATRCSSEYGAEDNNHMSSAASSDVKCEQRVGDTEWTVVRKKSAKSYKLIGQRGCAPNAPSDKFKAADIKIPLLISNVSKDTCEEDIINYIKEKTNECVTLNKINMRQTKMYNSFKLYVSKNNINVFLKDDFWPNGISFRRFVHFMYRTKANKTCT